MQLCVKTRCFYSKPGCLSRIFAENIYKKELLTLDTLSLAYALQVSEKATWIYTQRLLSNQFPFINFTRRICRIYFKNDISHNDWRRKNSSFGQSSIYWWFSNLVPRAIDNLWDKFVTSTICTININVIVKTMCPPGYHLSGFVATHAVGNMMYDCTAN